jgi:ATP-grasp domain
MDLNFGLPSAAAPRLLLTDTNRWPATARLAMALSKAGCDISAVCPIPGHPLLKTSVVRQAFPYSGLRPLESLQAAIEATQPQLIIPCDDRGVQHLHNLHSRAGALGASANELVSLIERSLGSPESFPIVSSRYELLRVAEEAGIRVPCTGRIRTIDDLWLWRQERAFPSVLKIDGTWGGRGVRIATTQEEAEAFFLELTGQTPVLEGVKHLLLNRDRSWRWPWWRRTAPAAIIQEYVQGYPANCAVACWEGTILAGIGVEVVSSQGVKGPATVVRVVDNPAMMLAAERLASRLRLSGVFGLDFMIEEGTADTYLIEMNPRCTPLCHLQLGEGRDLAGSIAAMISESPYRPSQPVTNNDLIAYFPQASGQTEFLASSFYDVPHDEPDLIKELLRPLSERSWLGRMVDCVRDLTFPAPASAHYIFEGPRPKPSAVLPETRV